MSGVLGWRRRWLSQKVGVDGVRESGGGDDHSTLLSKVWH